MNRVPRPDRESADIIHDLLAFVNKEPQLKTWIMYRCNLNSKQIRDYIDILLHYKLIAEVEAARMAPHMGKFVYQTTEKGRTYLVTYGKLKELFK